VSEDHTDEISNRFSQKLSILDVDKSPTEVSEDFEISEGGNQGYDKSYSNLQNSHINEGRQSGLIQPGHRPKQGSQFY
jgi:hypothetical protein